MWYVMGQLKVDILGWGAECVYKYTCVSACVCMCAFACMSVYRIIAIIKLCTTTSAYL